MNNIVYINCFMLFEKCLLVFLLYKWNLKNEKRRTDSYLLILLFIILWIYYAFFCSGNNGRLGIYNQLNVYGTLTASIIAVLAAVRVIRIVEMGKEILMSPVFWALTAIFVYSSVSLIVISTVFLMPQSAWILFQMTNVIYFLILTKAFLVAGNSK